MHITIIIAAADNHPTASSHHTGNAVVSSYVTANDHPQRRYLVSQPALITR